MAALTVGIPVFNEEAFLEETLESLRRQRFSDFTAWICDNSSTDRSAQIAGDFARRDERFRLVVHPRNIGGTGNFRYCLSLADTEFFAWLGAHDVLREEYYARTVGALRDDPRLVMAYSRALLIDRAGRTIGRADSGIDTRGLPVGRRLRKVVRRLECCTAIHGVFRSALLQSLPDEQLVGADHLLLYLSALEGEFAELLEDLFLRRQVREETPEQAFARTIDTFGVRSQRFPPHLLLAAKHFEHTLRFARLDWPRRVAYGVQAAAILTRRFAIGDWRLWRAVRKPTGM